MMEWLLLVLLLASLLRRHFCRAEAASLPRPCSVGRHCRHGWVVVILACLANRVVLAIAEATEGNKPTALWRHVSVEPSWVTSGVPQEPRNQSLVGCGAACMMHTWCRLWCYDTPRECLLTSLTVSASYTPAQPEGTLSCYTSQLPDLSVGAIITSSPHVHAHIKHRENLVDGIYSGNILDCGIVTSGNGADAWFLLDLGVVYPISEVVLVAQPNAKAVHHFRDIEVRVGSEEMLGNFSMYQLLGTFTSLAEPEETIVLRGGQPIAGRYVSIQRTTDGYLQIAHLEIR